MQMSGDISLPYHDESNRVEIQLNEAEDTKYEMIFETKSKSIQ